MTKYTMKKTKTNQPDFHTLNNNNNRISSKSISFKIAKKSQTQRKNARSVIMDFIENNYHLFSRIGGFPLAYEHLVALLNSFYKRKPYRSHIHTNVCTAFGSSSKHAVDSPPYTKRSLIRSFGWWGSH